MTIHFIKILQKKEMNIIYMKKLKKLGNLKKHILILQNSIYNIYNERRNI